MLIGMLKEICLSLLITLANFWIWNIYKEDLLLFVLLILLSISLFLLSFVKFKKIIGVVTFLIVIIITIQILRSGFDNKLIKLDSIQEKQLNERHIYLANELGIVYKNKLSLRFYKDIYPYLSSYVDNIFNSLSHNLYFFASHPREREEIREHTLIVIFGKLNKIICMYLLLGVL